MENNEWIRAIDEGELKEGVPAVIEVEEEKRVLLVRSEGRIYACGNECSHYHAPLSDGLLVGHVVTCPWHNARFDVRNGSLVAPPGLNGVPSYETKVEDGQVWIRLAGKGTISMPGGEDDRTFLIVGAGAAGNSAAETLRREGFAGRIVMVTREAHGPYDRTMLSKDLLSGEAPAKWLPLRGQKFYDRLNIELMTGKQVASLDPAGRSVTFADGSSMAADAILLATGGEPRTLPVPGVEKSGIYLLRSRRDAEAILGELETAKTVIVVGASFIGLEVAGALRSREIEVHVAAPEQIPLATIFGEQIGGRIKQSHEDNGVTFHLGRSVKEFAGAERVSEVVLSDGKRLNADCVIVGVGIRPAVDFLADGGLVKDGAVQVDGRLQTTAEGIFAAGDIAVVPDGRTGEVRRVEHWVEAGRQGMHAARSMLGSQESYSAIPFFWSKQYGSSLRYLGYAPEFDRIVFRGSVADKFFLAGFYQKGKLAAAATVGKARELIRLGQLLEAGKSVHPEQLEDPDFDLLSL
jgi:NADPH-dependent 2,4-dienoyl-CoA reductase/sulfur reductase-like enzyme/nitrite reductase/ring-hydroxylating ferredoxin subunit